MSNKIAAPFGFTPLRHMSGGNIVMTEYPIKGTYATKIYNGDLVENTTDAGFLQLAGADAAAVTGVFLGCMFINSKGEQVFSPYYDGAGDNTDVKAIVVDDAQVTFKVQSNQAITQADIGTSVANVAGTGMLDSIGRSTAVLGAASSNNIFTIRGIVPTSQNVSDNNTNLDVEVVCTAMGV